MNDRTSSNTAYAMEIGGREEQQDSVGIETIEKNSILIVADGMGGHEGGKAASKILVEEAIRLFRAASGQIEDTQTFFTQIIQNSYEKIREYEKQHHSSPHSTVVILLIIDTKACWAHIGDCRLIHFHRGKFIERTRDHSVVELLYRQGEITEAEMATHPDQNKLLKSVGGNSLTEPGLGESVVKPGDAFLLCSDGLWESVTTDEMAEVLFTVPLQQAVDYLVGFANERTDKSGDNVSCAVYVPQQLVKPRKARKNEATQEITVASTFQSTRTRKRHPLPLILALVFVLTCILLITGYLFKKEIGVFKTFKSYVAQVVSGDRVAVEADSLDEGLKKAFETESDSIFESGSETPKTENSPEKNTLEEKNK